PLVEACHDRISAIVNATSDCAYGVDGEGCALVVVDTEINVGPRSSATSRVRTTEHDRPDTLDVGKLIHEVEDEGALVGGKSEHSRPARTYGAARKLVPRHAGKRNTGREAGDLRAAQVTGLTAGVPPFAPVPVFMPPRPPSPLRGARQHRALRRPRPDR